MALNGILVTGLGEASSVLEKVLQVTVASHCQR